MSSEASHRTEPPMSSLDSPSITPPNLDTLPPETIVVHVLPYLSNGEKGALAKTCSRLLRLLRHERVYRLSAPCTRKYLEDVAFCEEVKARIPAGKLVLCLFGCAIQAFHFMFKFNSARTLFAEVLADESATEVEKARARLSLFVLYCMQWGGPADVKAEAQRRVAARASAPALLRAGDERDPVHAFEMGICHFFGIGTKVDVDAAHSLFVTSANGGCAAGLYFLGKCLLKPSLTAAPRDPSTAAAHFATAAAMGHYGATFELGDCFYYGRGVSRFERGGVALIRSAAVDEGDWRAKEWLGRTHFELALRDLWPSV